MPHQIPNEDWIPYENYKTEVNEDSSVISCDIAWELGHLSGLIRKHFPHKPDQEIMQAIYSCRDALGSPSPRQELVDCIIKRLE